MNLVLVIFDSLRQDHLGAYGNQWIHTPHLDAFAKEAMVFTHCYPESLPTVEVRRALFTGKRVFPFHGHRAYRGDVDRPIPGWGPLPEEDISLSEVLSPLGYRSALITDCYHIFKPMKNYHRGFDVWRLIRGQEVDRYRTGVKIYNEEFEAHLNEHMKGEPGIAEFFKIWKRNTSHRQDEEDYFTARVFREAGKWLFENQDAENFFMVVDSFDPHEPWDPPQYYRKLYDPDDDGCADLIQSPYHKWDEVMTPRELKRIQANYAGEVTMCDRWFGHFMENLKLQGRLDDTVVAVVSDHGHSLGYDPGDKGYVSKQGYPLTRSVADTVAMIRHPKGEGAGWISGQMCQNFDLTATLLNLIGVSPPEEMEGLDLWPAALGKRPAPREHASCVWGTVGAVVDETWWYNADLWRQGALLYNHKDDPDLTRNLAPEHPEVCQNMHERLMADAGNRLPEFLEGYQDRGGCGLAGWPGGPYGSTKSVITAK